MSAARLDADLLALFESTLLGVGVDTDALAPGLSDAQIDALVEPLGLHVPEEVRAWWRWHNGHQRGRRVYLLPHRVMLPIREALWHHADHVQAGNTQYVDPPAAIRPVSEKPVILLSCQAAGDVPAPVHVVQDWAYPSKLVLPSFGEVVLTWIDYIEQGVYATEPGGGWKEVQDYSPEVLSLGVA